MKELRRSREEVAVWLGFALEKAIDLSPDEVTSVLSDLLTLHDRLREAERILGHDKSNDAYLNLEGAIIDIETSGDGYCDRVSMRTLKRVAGQIARAQQALADSTP